MHSRCRSPEQFPSCLTQSHLQHGSVEGALQRPNSMSIRLPCGDVDADLLDQSFRKPSIRCCPSSPPPHEGQDSMKSQKACRENGLQKKEDVFIHASKGRRRGLLSAPRYRVRDLSSSPVLLIRDMHVTASRDTCVAAGPRVIMHTRLCSDLLGNYTCAKCARTFRDTLYTHMLFKTSWPSDRRRCAGGLIVRVCVCACVPLYTCKGASGMRVNTQRPWLPAAVGF